jgi:ABC-2 type transport system ATP-binding protein
MNTLGRECPIVPVAPLRTGLLPIRDNSTVSDRSAAHYDPIVTALRFPPFNIGQQGGVCFGYCGAPMIEVRDLTKWFGRFRAVSEVSFEVAPGEVVGLLGANGAGKTTTQRMITGFLPPDAGSVSINGHDSLESSAAARGCTGYLPEAAPAYGEMGTEDYLHFRGRLYGLRRGVRREAVARVLEACDLAEVRRRRVGHLSRGYRQRVGLAAAILHDPPVLVLDEPTSALDPRQIRQIRGLIRELAGGGRGPKSKAILVSSHILPEVEQTCDRVVVMARGRVLAQGTPEELVSQSRTAPPYVIEARVSAGASAELLQKLQQVRGVEAAELLDGAEGWSRVRITSAAGAGDLREGLAAAAASAGALVRELHRERPNLERVFLELMDTAAAEQEAA